MKSLRNLKRQAQRGFTLIELMIVVAIIGILAAVALPAYQQYTNKSKFSEVIQATSALKVAVELCFNDTNDLTACDAGTNNIPADIAATTGVSKYVASLVTENGIITATAKGTSSAAVEGLKGETYILTPTAGTGANAGKVTWAITGTCGAANYCKQ